MEPLKIKLFFAIKFCPTPILLSLFGILAVAQRMKKTFSMPKQSLPQHDAYTQDSHQNNAGLQHCHIAVGEKGPGG